MTLGYVTRTTKREKTGEIGVKGRLPTQWSFFCFSIYKALRKCFLLLLLFLLLEISDQMSYFTVY